jgi:hypothetical protein
MILRSRGRPRAEITMAHVEAIRNMSALGLARRIVAVDIGISVTTVARIERRIGLFRRPRGAKAPLTIAQGRPFVRVTPAIVAAIRNLSPHWTQIEISALLGCSRTTIKAIQDVHGIARLSRAEAMRRESELWAVMWGNGTPRRKTANDLTRHALENETRMIAA